MPDCCALGCARDTTRPRPRIGNTFVRGGTMKSLWIALGIMGMIPLLAAAQSPAAGHSVIKQVGFGQRISGNCTTCGTGGPGCSTVVPAPTCGPANCCPRPCLLEAFKRGLRSIASVPAASAARATAALAARRPATAAVLAAEPPRRAPRAAPSREPTSLPSASRSAAALVAIWVARPACPSR
jgi:hypothetical protein